MILITILLTILSLLSYIYQITTYLFAFPHTLIKLVVIIIGIIAIYCLYMRPYKLKLKLSYLREIAIKKQLTISKECINDGPFTFFNKIANMVREKSLLEKPIWLSAQKVNEQKGLPQPLKKVSVDENRDLFFNLHDTMLDKMKQLQNGYENDKSIDWTIIEQWGEYIANRSTLHDYTPEEHKSHLFLKKLFTENTKDKDVILAQLTDKLQRLKIKSNLSNIELYTKIQDKCFIEDDFKDKVKAIKEALTVLQTNMSLNDNALILFAILSDVMLLDEDNNPKLTREVYQVKTDYPELFNIKFAKEKPDSKEIFHLLNNKMYLIKQNSTDIPEGHIVSTAPLLHKTIIIPTKNGIYYVAMFTSSKTKSEVLSLTQECNLDPEAINKEQRFVVYSSFILCNDSEITIDLLSLGFTHATNLEGEDVHQKIMKFFEEKQHEWENNFIQELVIVNSEILRNISIMFLKKHLDNIEEEYQEFLLKFENLSIDKKKERSAILLKTKEHDTKRKTEQQYLSKLSSNFKKLYSFLNLFEKEVKHQKESTIEQENKKRIKVLNEEHKKKREAISKEEQQKRKDAGIFTAAERRKALQDQLKEKANAQSHLKIEDKDSK